MKPSIEHIRDVVPGLPGSPPQRIDGGQNAYVLDFGVDIVRIPRYAGHASVLQREADILESIGPLLPLSTPQIVTYQIDGVTVAVHRRIAGHPLRIIEPDRALVIASTLGAFLHTLHAIPVPTLIDLGVPVADRTFWIHWIQDVRDRLSPSLSTQANARFDLLAKRFLTDIGSLPFVVTHGDFGAGNILAEHGYLTGVIDFGSVTVGDPAADVAGLAASYGDGFLDLLVGTYPQVTAMRPRISFYRLAFAAMEALHGLDHDDTVALRAGIDSLERPL